MMDGYELCRHPTKHVTADILEGDWSFHAVQWCQRCGAYRHGFDLEPCTGQPQRFGEWHKPEMRDLVGYPEDQN